MASLYVYYLYWASSVMPLHMVKNSSTNLVVVALTILSSSSPGIPVRLTSATNWIGEQLPDGTQNVFDPVTWSPHVRIQ